MNKVIIGFLLFANCFFSHAQSQGDKEIEDFKRGMSMVESEAAKPGASDKVKKLAETLKEADRHKREYEKAKSDAWAYSEIGKCHKISEEELQDVFIRFMMVRHNYEANHMLFDPSPKFAKERQKFANEFVEKEYLPKAKGFYLSNNRCPSIRDLYFDY